MKIIHNEFESKLIEMGYCIRNSMISKEAVAYIFSGERPVAFVSLFHSDDYFIEPACNWNKEFFSLITSYARTPIKEREYDEVIQEWYDCYAE